MQYLVKIISALHCFLDGCCIAVPVLVVIRKPQLRHQLYNYLPDCGLPNGSKLSNSLNYC